MSATSFDKQSKHNVIKYKRGGHMNIDELIKENREKLEQMIISNEDKQKIVKQSQILDEYINIKMKLVSFLYS